ncbi:MAG TPA: alpha/beta hydrolase, partial [Mycobacterium sp.]|nr:alpha/beta hydrolase [Mycobacterium sp.]
MLLDVAAFAASVSLTGVSEAFGVHEINAQIFSHVQQVDISPATVPDASQFSLQLPLSPVDPTLLPQLGGPALLEQLGLIDADSLAAFVSAHPATVNQLLQHPPAAREVTGWWGGLSTVKKEQMLASAPHVVGNLGGVPFDVRDAANREYLKQSLATLEDELAVRPGRAVSAGVRGHLHTLDEIGKAVKPEPGQPPRTLVSLDTGSPSRAAIVVGDLTSADYVSYMVPGMFFTIDGQVGDWADTATDLYREQVAWLKHFASTDRSLQGKTVATVAWIGYETPHLLTVGSLDLAHQGAEYLTQDIEALQSLRDGTEPFVSVIGHSYGSTAAMLALQRRTFQIDAFAVVGSPGSAAQSVSALDVRGGNMYVGEAAWDPVVNTAFYGSDPGAASYGAHPM